MSETLLTSQGWKKNRKGGRSNTILYVWNALIVISSKSEVRVK